jgi:hypothetical protein
MRPELGADSGEPLRRAFAARRQHEDDPEERQHEANVVDGDEEQLAREAEALADDRRDRPEAGEGGRQLNRANGGAHQERRPAALRPRAVAVALLPLVLARSPFSGRCSSECPLSPPASPRPSPAWRISIRAAAPGAASLRPTWQRRRQFRRCSGQSGWGEARARAARDPARPGSALRLGRLR